MYSAFSANIAGQTMPSARNHRDHAGLGGFAVQARGWWNSSGEAGGPKHHKKPGSWVATPAEAKPVDFCGGLGLEGAGLLDGSGCGEQGPAAQAVSTVWFLGRKKANQSQRACIRLHS